MKQDLSKRSPAIKAFILFLKISLLILFVGEFAVAQVRVRGYTRKDGTYVRPHYRSNPRGSGGSSYRNYGRSNSPLFPTKNTVVESLFTTKFIDVARSATSGNSETVDDEKSLEYHFPFDSRLHGSKPIKVSPPRPSLVTDGLGNRQSAIEFKSPKSVLSIERLKKSLGPNDSFSLSVWVSPGAQLSDHAHIFQITGDTDQMNAVLSFRGVSNTFEFLVIKQGVSGDLCTSKRLTDWTHLVGVVGGGVMTLFVNGEKRESKSISLGLGSKSSRRLVVGGMPNRGFIGKLDDVRLYNRSLSDDEIQTLFVDYVKLNGISKKEKNEIRVLPTRFEILYFGQHLIFDFSTGEFGVKPNKDSYAEK